MKISINLENLGTMTAERFMDAISKVAYEDKSRIVTLRDSLEPSEIRTECEVSIAELDTVITQTTECRKINSWRLKHGRSYKEKMQAELKNA